MNGPLGPGTAPKAERSALAVLAEEIHACSVCPRLAGYLGDCRERFPEYWARPVAGYGDPEGRLLLVGLAPGYHGSNRTGRVFTGDASGLWLWKALHEVGVASQPVSASREDGMVLRDVWITAAVRCAPPQNRPSRSEQDACFPYLEREVALLPRINTVLALGHLAHDTYLRLWGERPSRHPFGHMALHELPGEPRWLLDSYHPSRQNTNTGRLTWEMWIGAITEAVRLSQRLAAGVAPSAEADE
ncbi:MAG: uracil-DNA glycosylase [Armatimonadetes bacterium]|nr:uracil-DNA glycosylase [Armatimonadota bacterium]